MIPGRTIDRSLLCLQSLLSKTVPTPLLARPGGDAQGVHVDGLKDAFGQIFFHGRGELRHEEVQEDRELLPLGVSVRQD